MHPHQEIDDLVKEKLDFHMEFLVQPKNKNSNIFLRCLDLANHLQFLMLQHIVFDNILLGTFLYCFDKSKRNFPRRGTNESIENLLDRTLEGSRRV